MATMERVTQPSGETRQPQSSSLKVARERIGTAGSRKLIHSDRHRRTRLDRDMSNRMGIENDPHWPPRCLRQTRASSAAASRFTSHVKCYLGFHKKFFRPVRSGEGRECLKLRLFKLCRVIVWAHLLFDPQ